MLLATIRTGVEGIKLRHIYTTLYTILFSPELGYIFFLKKCFTLLIFEVTYSLRASIELRRAVMRSHGLGTFETKYWWEHLELTGRK